METTTISNDVFQALTAPNDGLVILPLKKWKSIEGELEDLEMYRSDKYIATIANRRKEAKTISLANMLKKYKT